MSVSRHHAWARAARIKCKRKRKTNTKTYVESNEQTELTIKTNRLIDGEQMAVSGGEVRG